MILHKKKLQSFIAETHNMMLTSGSVLSSSTFALLMTFNLGMSQAWLDDAATQLTGEEQGQID